MARLTKSLHVLDHLYFSSVGKH